VPRLRHNSVAFGPHDTAIIERMSRTRRTNEQDSHDLMIGRFGHVASVVYHAGRRDGIGAVPATGSDSHVEQEGGVVREGDTPGLEAGTSHILFPVAVGVVFLAMLVAGALFG